MTVRPRAILIDLDGVLRQRDQGVAAGCEQDAGLEAGSLLAAAFEPNLLTAAVTGRIDQDQWENEVIKALSQRQPHADVATAVHRCLGDVGYIDTDVLAVVDAVRPHATVCLVSNASSRLHADLDVLGLTEHVDHVVSSADLGVAKPDPRIFAAAARLVGVPPERCLMVDDAAKVTVAAEAAGMTGHTFTDTTSLRQAIDQWLSRDFSNTGVPEAADRHAVRVLCLDPDDRLLLLQWRDPVSGELLWEPPGGQVNPDESTFDAARRELVEETGLLEAVLDNDSVPVRRDSLWCGLLHRNVEPFFLARVSGDPATTAPRLSTRERETLTASRWWTWSELLGTRERIEPPELAAVLGALVPSGPWLSITRIVDQGIEAPLLQ